MIEFFEQYSTMIYAFATTILVGITGWYAWLTKSILISNEKSTNEMLRPYVVTHIYPEDEILFFKVENLGKRPALSFVTIIEPPLDLIDKIKLADEDFPHKRMLNQSFIPPNYKVVTALDLNKYYVTNNDLPREFTVTNTYLDSNNKKYEESYILDMNNYNFPEKLVNYSDSYYLKKIAKHLEEIQERN